MGATEEVREEDLVAQKVVREEKLPLVQSDVADHEVYLDMEW